MDTVTYDVIGNQGREYEVIKKRPSTGTSTSTGTGKEFTLSKCPAYDPVGTLASQEVRGQPAEYEVVQTTST